MKLLYIDLFCGAGGTSTGVEKARLENEQCAKVIACVNHDKNAIASHAANHPDALHFTEDIRTLNLSPLVSHLQKCRAEYPEALIVAEITDKNGNVKRLNNYYIKFFVEGEGRILGGANVLANPAPVKWGSAPVLIQSTTTPGKIKVRASVLFEGSQMPVSGELELTSSAPMYPLIFDKKEEALPKPSESFSMDKKSDAELELERRRRELNELKLKEVEQQQTDFGEKVD